MSITKAEGLKFSPAKVTFYSQDQQLSYQTFTQLTNQTSRPTRVKLSKSTSSFIEVKLPHPTFFLAAGMSQHIAILLKEGHKFNVSETIKATEQGGTSAFLQISVTRKDPSLFYLREVRFGIVSIDSKLRASLQFCNRGSKKISLFLFPKDRVRVQEKSFLIQPAETKLVAIELQPSGLGENEFEVDVENQYHQPYEPIRILTTFAKFEKLVTIEDKAVGEYCFQPIYYSIERKFKLRVVNNSPQSSAFSVSSSKPHQGVHSEEETPESLAQSLMTKDIIFDCEAGRVAPFSFFDITGTIICPPDSRVIAEFEKFKHRYRDQDSEGYLAHAKKRVIQVVLDEAETFRIEVSVMTVTPAVSFSESCLDFSLDSTQKLFFRNHRNQPVKIVFHRNPCLQMKRRVFQLEPEENVCIDLHYRPRLVCQMQNYLKYEVQSSFFKGSIKITGPSASILARNRLSSVSSLTVLQPDSRGIKTKQRAASIGSRLSLKVQTVPQTEFNTELEEPKFSLPKLRASRQHHDSTAHRSVQLCTIESLPPIARSKKQRGELSKKLSLSQLALIKISCSQLQFPTTFNGLATRASLSVTNGNSGVIGVRFVNRLSEVAISSGSRALIIPGNREVRVQFVWLPKQGHKLNSLVHYRINDFHEFPLRLLGESTPLDIAMSPNRLEFSFQETSTSLSSSGVVYLTNPNQIAAEFQWEYDHESPFQIDSLQGVISPNERLPVKIDYTPTQNGKDQCLFQLKIKQGRQYPLYCYSKAEHSRVKVLPLLFDFQSYLQQVTQLSLRVKNLNASPTAYKIDFGSLGKYLDILSPLEGSVPESKYVDLKFNFKCSHAQNVKGLISLKVRALNDILIPFNARVSTPLIKLIGQNFIDFGQVVPPGVASKVFFLQNLASQQVTFTLDMPEKFQKSLVLQFKDRQIRRGGFFTVLPNCTQQFSFKFTVTNFNKQFFGVKLTSEERTLEFDVTCEGVESTFIVQNVLQLRKILNKGSHCVEPLLIINKSNQHWEFELEILGDNSRIFSLETTKGELPPKTNSNIRVLFEPQTAGQFEMLLVVRARQKFDQDRIQKYIELKGIAELPELSLEQQLICLPASPLGRVVHTTLFIFNKGFQNTVISCQLPQNRVNLSVEFPEGTSLSVTKPKLPVKVSACSSESVSFIYTAKIVGAGSQSYQFTIQGTFVNSLLLNQDTTTGINIISDEQGRFFQELNCKSKQNLLEDQRAILTQIMNSKVLPKGREIEDYPGPFVSDFTYLQHLLEVFCPNTLNKWKDTQKKPQAPKAQLQVLFKLLKGDGCLMSHLRVEHFLQDPAQVDSATIKRRRQSAWVQLFFQIARVYWINRIDKLPQGKATSNLSSQEVSLLNWVWQERKSQAGQALNSILQAICHYFSDKLKKFQTGLKRSSAIKWLTSIFDYLGVTLFFRQDSIGRFSPRALLLLIAFSFNLYQNLLLTTPVDIKCKLLETVVVKLSFKNISDREEHFKTKMLHGKSGYSVEQPQFKLGGGAVGTISVRFKCQHRKSADDVLLVCNPRILHQQFCTGFVLRATVNKDHCLKLYKVSCPMYSTEELELQFVNVFKQDATFSITVAQQVSEDSFASRYIDVYSCFRLRTDRLRVGSQAKGVVSIIFCPVIFTTIVGEILFSDPSVGQFTIKVQGEVTLPKPQVLIRPPGTCYIRTKYPVSIPIRASEKGFSEQSSIAHNESKRSLLNQSQNSKSSQDEGYEVEVITTLAESVSFSPTIHIPKSAKQVQMDLVFEVPTVTSEAKYVFVLKNRQLTDIKCIQVGFPVIYRPQTIRIRLRAEVFKEAVQSIPILNPGASDCTYTVVDTKERPASFFLSFSECVVAAESTQSLVVSYRPKSMAREEYGFILRNNKMIQELEVSIEGIPIDQSPVQTFSFQCEAGQAREFQIKLPRMQNWARVEIDLDIVKSLEITEGGLFRGRMQPTHIGIYQGNLTFFDVDKTCWYKVRIDTTGTRPAFSKEVAVKTREEKQFSFEVPARSSRPNNEYSVSINSEFLVGERYFTLDRAKKEYSIICLPYFKDQIEVKIFFTSQDEQFFVLIKCITVRMRSKLPNMRAELGEVAQCQVRVSNPLLYPLKVQCFSSSPVFYFPCKEYHLDPVSSTDIQIHYKPETLGVEQSKIQFATPENGSWMFLIAGQGQTPHRVNSFQFQAQLGSTTLKELFFRNPFSHQISVTVTFDKCNKFGEQLFKLVVPAADQRIFLNSNQLLRITMSVNPTSNRSHFCSLRIVFVELIFWVYQVRASVVYTSPKPRLLKCQCYSQEMQILPTELPGLLPPYKEQQFTYSVKANASELAQVQRILQVKPNYQAQEAEFTILGYKPIKMRVVLQISHDQGGEWRFPVDIEMLNNSVFGRVLVEGKMNEVSVSRFTMNNRNKQDVPFRTYFHQSGDTVFLVSPREGILPGQGKPGLPFIVTFIPAQYRKTFSGLLYIQSEQTQWKIEVKGRFQKTISKRKK